MPEPSTGRSPSPANRGSLLSKLATPFGSKTRNISEFYIQPDDPHRVYGLGDSVTGSVVLKVVKPLRVTHLACCLHGFVQVYKAPNNPGDGYRAYSAGLMTGRSKRPGGHHTNGFTPLFEDEVVLCGDGRLGEGTYQFQFELQFPPEKMPSSIDFDRGTISYVITSTLTRPTTIGPTMTCERKIWYQELIDIAGLERHEPRYISLEPIPRRPRPRRKPRHAELGGELKQIDEQRPSAEVLSDYQTTTVSSAAFSSTDGEPPQSPAPSDISFGSEPSTGSAVDTNSQSARTGDSKQITEWSSKRPTQRNRPMKPITASIELRQTGYLRGDNVHVKIDVQHTKQIKSLHGIIVTLYRLARVNMRPSISKVGSADGKVAESLTVARPGFRGLSISGSGPNHQFRKDLSQAFASLMINPNTMRAEVKATVRVPEGAFPTIADVPGGMISFKYYVEVVVDIQGKLAGLDRFLPNAGMSGVATHNLDGSIGLPVDAGHSVFAPWGGHFVDTEEIKRDRSVVFDTFEVLVGTTDSARKGKWCTHLPEPSDDNVTSGSAVRPRSETNTSTVSGQRQGRFEDVATEAENSTMYQRQLQTDRPAGCSCSRQRLPDEPPPPIAAIPIPDLAAEEQHLSEKELMRRREARLLPSQPPEENDEPNPTYADHAPSAPVLDEAPPPWPSTSREQGSPSAPPLDNLYGGDEDTAGPSAPAYHQHLHGVENIHAEAATDDKQELQRQRLQLQRSEPPADDQEPAPSPEERDVSSTQGIAEDEPSAPTIEDISLGFSSAAMHDPSLPRYER